MKFCQRQLELCNDELKQSQARESLLILTHLKPTFLYVTMLSNSIQQLRGHWRQCLKTELLRSPLIHCTTTSGAGTNSKVGGTSPARKWGHRFFWSCPSTFLALNVRLVVLVSAFVIVSTVWSVSCLQFFYLRCPAICKKWGHVPPCPMESAPLTTTILYSTDGNRSETMTKA